MRIHMERLKLHKSYGRVSPSCPIVSGDHRNAVFGRHLGNRCSNALVQLVPGENVRYGIQSRRMGPLQVLWIGTLDGP